jgi:hypothetical protein
MTRWIGLPVLLLVAAAAIAQVPTGGGLNVTGTPTANFCPLATGAPNQAVWGSCQAGGGSPGGSTGQIQTNAGAGNFGGITVSGDGTLNGSTGALNIVSTHLASPLPINQGGTAATITSQSFAFIGPSGTSGAPSFRALVLGDLPAIANNQALANTTGGSAQPSATPVNGLVAVTAASAITGSTATLTPGSGTQISATLQSNTTITVSSGASDSQPLVLRLKQDSTGSRTVAFDSSVKFGTDITNFTASTAANAVDLVGLKWDATEGVWFFVAYARGF